MFRSLITSRIALHENIIVAHSKLLFAISSGDLFLTYFIVLSLTARGYSTWC